MNSLHTLLSDILDYAGLYPPAGLPLPEVVSNYSGYRLHPEAWMLARLIIPVQRLAEFAELASPVWRLSAPEQLPWRISCLVPGPVADLSEFRAAWDCISDFNLKQTGSAVIDAVETKADDPNLIRSAAQYCAPQVATYWELPHTKSCADSLAALSELGPAHRAKIRTGGVQATLIASVDDVARFLSECAASRVAFKATAGLHHPLRAEYRLTYAVDSPCATMHGFLNLFTAAVAAWRQQATPEVLRQLLSLTAPDEFHFDESGLKVLGLQLSQEDMAATRRDFAIGFGSCSFSEPVEDLCALGWLPVPESHRA